MARHYHYEVARWEAEGGAPVEGRAFSESDLLSDAEERDSRARSILHAALGIAILTGLIVYARQKRWI